jgi:indole-3-glycerol phosphate synthase
VTVSLAESIRRRQHEQLMPVLAEIKVRSPKDGDLLRGRAPEILAKEMAACPIAGLSVVTEPDDFGGNLDIVRRVRPVVPVPILRKDFLRSEGELDETVAAGADAVLSTVCMQEDEPLARLHAAARERGLETLVEVRDEEDVGRVQAAGLRPDCRAGHVILAGGLTPENVGPTVEAVRPYAVDVISSVEGPAHRDRAKVRSFIRAAKQSGALA